MIVQCGQELFAQRALPEELYGESRGKQSRRISCAGSYCFLMQIQQEEPAGRRVQRAKARSAASPKNALRRRMY